MAHCVRMGRPEDDFGCSEIFAEFGDHYEVSESGEVVQTHSESIDNARRVGGR